MIVNAHKILDAVRTNEISQTTINQIVIKIDDPEQHENNRIDDFEELRKALLSENDKAFLKLLRTVHYNTENGIPKGSNGETPLHLVCAEGRNHLTKKLLGYGKRIIVDYSDAMSMHDQTMGFTPFLTAAMNGHHQCFQILLHKLLHSLQTNAFNGHAILSFFNSKKQGRFNVLGNLVFTEKRTNLLHIVAQQQHVKILKCLFKKAKKERKLCSGVIEPMLMAFDPTDSTPLHLAARLNHSNIVKQLFDLAILCSNLSHTQVTSAKENSNESEEDPQDDDDDEEDDDINQPVVTNHSNINRQNTNSSANLSGRNSTTLPVTNLNQRTTQTPIMKQPISNKSSKMYATMITKQNAYQCAPIHEAAQEGHIEIVKQFINVAVPLDQQKILTIKNKYGQTALHLAALKGHVETVEFILKHIGKENIIIKDKLESTPLHSAAKASKKNHDNSAKVLHQFIEAQKRWFTVSDWLSERSIDILTERNAGGYNCLEVAIMNKNRPFVEYIFDLNSTQWEVLMRNAQIENKAPEVDTPMRKLIKFMPDMAYKVFNKCVKPGNDINEAKGKKTFKYDFEFLEDHCHVQNWIPKNQSKKTDQIESSKKPNAWLEKFPKSFHTITFRDNSNKKADNLPAFSNDPRILVKNHVLSAITNSATLSDISDEDKVKSNTRLLKHPLCQQLSFFKWKQFGFFIFFTGFLTYVLFLALFTWATIRNIDPAKFYDAVNVSYGNIDLSRNLESCKSVFDKLNARDSQSIEKLDHRKDQTDYILKYILYIILWLHIVKGLLMIGVYRTRFRGRFYAEVIALLLCFIYLYDDPNWQKDTRFRCFGQWQTGAFGLFLAWATLLAYIRFIPYFGLYVVMLEVIINKFIWFAPVLIILISSFAFSFFMLLQSQVPFQTVGFAWLRTAFMLTDMSYEGRLYGSNGTNLVILYPVVIALFICYGVAIFILVTNLLIGLAVGEIPTLLQLSRLQTLIIRYEFLDSSEIFRLQYLCTPSKIYLNEEITESDRNNCCTKHLKWFRQHAFFRPSHRIDDNDED